MRRILWIAAVVALCRLPAAAQAEEPRGGLIERGRAIVQAGFHKNYDRRASTGPACSSCSSSSCGSSGSSCGPCGLDDARVGKLIDTLFYAERACDRKNAALRLDAYDWTEHPEIVAALTYAMQSDCERCVRIAAADSMKDMRVADPDSIGAMQFTRAEDPSCRVRYKAKWGVIRGEESRPACQSYVSGYGYPVGESDQYERPARPRLQPTPEPRMPGPERKPLDDPESETTTTKRGVRSMISNAMAKVRPRS
jgi:hypothetical protein